MNLNLWRKKLDEIDEKIIKLVASRIKVIPEIARFKKENDLARFDAEREKKIKEKISFLAGKEGVSPELAQKIIELLIAESHRIEREIIGK